MADHIETVAWYYLLYKARQRRLAASRRRVWIHQTIRRREEFGEFHHLLQELRQDEVRFQRYFRLSRPQFDDLLSRIGARITYQDTNYRRSIPAEERLSICLRLVHYQFNHGTRMSIKMFFVVVASLSTIK